MWEAKLRACAVSAASAVIGGMRKHAWIFGVGLVLVGCGAGPSPSDAGQDAGSDAGVEDSGVIDSGTVDSGAVDSGAIDSGMHDAGSVDAGSDGGALTVIGSVSLFAVPGSGTNQMQLANAAFQRAAKVAPPDCSRAKLTVGACCLTSPPPPSDAGPDFLNAGDLAIDYSDAGFELGGSPQGYFTYQFPSPTFPKLVGGEQVRVVADGGPDAPPFVVAHPFPAPLTVSPAFGPGATLELDRSKDLRLTWTPQPWPAEVELVIAMAAPGVNGAIHGVLICTADDATGQLDVSKSLLADFQAGDECASCSLARRGVGTVRTNGAQVSLRLTRGFGGPVTVK